MTSGEYKLLFHCEGLPALVALAHEGLFKQGAEKITLALELDKKDYFRCEDLVFYYETT